MATLAALSASYTIVLPDEVHLLEVARVRKEALAQGRRAHWGDIYIGAVAVLQATPVVTANGADFRALGCQVLDYRRGKA
ncbi:MAG: type II toxin-antitoxin system VapC family toxin [Thermoplasmatota archaeon]